MNWCSGKRLFFPFTCLPRSICVCRHEYIRLPSFKGEVMLLLCVSYVLQVWTALTTWRCTRAWALASSPSPSWWWLSCSTERTTATMAWMWSTPLRWRGVSSRSISRPPGKVRGRSVNPKLARTGEHEAGRQRHHRSIRDRPPPPPPLIDGICLHGGALQGGFMPPCSVKGTVLLFCQTRFSAIVRSSVW